MILLYHLILEDLLHFVISSSLSYYLVSMYTLYANVEGVLRRLLHDLYKFIKGGGAVSK